MQTLKFKVRGSGQFPFDMLRYERAYPVHETEARGIDEHAGCDEYEVELAKEVDRISRRDPLEHLTPRRWGSFGFAVVEVNERPVPLEASR